MSVSASLPGLTRDDLTEGGTLVVLVWAPWEAYHPSMSAELLCFIENHKSARFRSLNIDEESYWETLREWNLVNVPALVLLRDGTHVETVHGVRTGDELTIILRGWLEA